MDHHFAESWLRAAPQPAPAMRVFDRNGALIGRIAEVRSGHDGAPHTLVVRSGLGLIGRPKELNCAYCRVTGPAVFTVLDRLQIS